MERLVSVITVNYNGIKFLEPCLNSLLKIDKNGFSLEIIMVDNLSKDGSIDFVKRRFPETKIIENDINKKFGSLSINERKNLSAELNGIISIYNDQKGENDIHFLIITDTFIGTKAGDFLKSLLQKLYKSNFNVLLIDKMNTKNTKNFLDGIEILINKCEDILPGYKESGYEVVFNLTGGFKSIQGYMNTIGMFYADELVYIFEAGKELIKIPKLQRE